MKVRVLVCAVLAIAATTFTPLAQQKAQNGDWPSYGRDPGAQRFSPLTQITPQNVATL
jgi:glucose dehydrogenase